MPEIVRQRYTGRLFIGLIVLTLGVLFMLDNFGFVDAHQALRWWPATFIAYGAMRVLGIGCRRGFVAGAVWMLFGALLLFGSLGYYPLSWNLIWPVLLIFWGIAILRGRGRFIGVAGYRRRGWRRINDYDPHADVTIGMGDVRHASPGSGGDTGASTGSAAAGESDSGWKGMSGDRGRYRSFESDQPTFSTFALMGSVARKVVSQQFQGGDVVAVMGGGDIDLRAARMATDTARIEVNLMMGGVNLFVPETWSVEFSGMPVMGSVEDRTQRPAQPVGRLLISGAIVMSSVIIRN